MLGCIPVIGLGNIPGAPALTCLALLFGPAVEDYVAWDSQIRFLSVGSLPPRENPRQNGSEALRRGADPGLTEELLPASDGLRCVLKLREELERVDGTFTRAVENFILVVSMLRAEAAHKRASIVQREDARARETIDKLRKGVHAGLKAALEDLYKQSFILMQVQMPRNPPNLLLFGSVFLLQSL